MQRFKTALSTESEDSQKRSKSADAVSFTLVFLLQKLNQGEYPQQIARELNKSKQLIHYHVRRLTNDGYVRQVTRSSITIYELTPKGQMAIDRHARASVVGRGGVLARFHHLAYRYLVVGGVAGFDLLLPRSGAKQMRGGVFQVDGTYKLDNEEFSIKRWHSPTAEHLTVYGPKIYSNDVHGALGIVSIKIDRVARSIADRFNIQFSDKIERLQRPEWAFEKDPFAKIWGQITGSIIKAGEGTIDASEGDWETEFFTPEGAQAYLRLPIEIQQIRKAMAESASSFQQVTERYSETTDKFGKEMNSHLALIEQIADSNRATADLTKALKTVVDEMRVERSRSLFNRLLGKKKS